MYLVHLPVSAWNRLKSELLHWHETFELSPLPSPAQQRIYMLSPDAFIQLDDWVNSFSTLWNDRLNKLDEHLKTINKKRYSNDTD